LFKEEQAVSVLFSLTL